MRISTFFFTLILVCNGYFGLAQTNSLSITDIYQGFMSPSMKQYINDSYRGEIYHVRDGKFPFLYGNSVSDSSLNFKIIKSDDYIKEYFSVEDFKSGASKLLLKFSIAAITSDTIYIDASLYSIPTGYFNKREKQLIGFIETQKLYAAYDRRLNKWVVDNLKNCIKCPDK